jgi:hypothetical protein
MPTAAVALVATVQIGARPAVHAMADGSGPVPRGRARCEIDKRAMTYRPYCEMRADGLGTDRDHLSRAAPLGPGVVTCPWCLTLDWLPA